MTKKILTDETELLQLDNTSTAVDIGPSSAIGRRNAYGALVRQQRLNFGGECNITFFSLLTCYKITRATTFQKNSLLEPPLLTIDRNGVIVSSLQNNKFQVGDIVFTRMRKLCVVNLCPFVPLSHTDERSCYSTLLVHTPWPLEGECELLGESISAVAKLALMTSTQGLPPYVLPALAMIQESKRIRDNQGIPQSNLNRDNNIGSDDYNDEEDNFDCLFDENGELINPVIDDIEDVSMRNLHGDGVEVMSNITKRRKIYYQNFIRNTQERHMISFKSQHQVDANDAISQYLIDTKRIVKVADFANRVSKLQRDKLELTIDQLTAYNKAVKHLSGETDEQLIMFISGEGGTGKSYLIRLLMEYTRLKFGKQKGLYGSALAMAPTGSAGHIIGGFTWQSVFNKSKKQSGKKNAIQSYLSPESAKAVGHKIHGVKLSIIDEVSMINLETLHEISQRAIEGLCAINNNQSECDIIKSKPFGGMHMIFTGDLYQLKPVHGKAVYETEKLDYLSRLGKSIWMQMNEYHELTENVRFRNDDSPKMQSFLSKARKGIVNTELLIHMNSRIMITEEEAKRKAGPDAIWVTHTNAEVNKYNSSDFKSKVKDGKTHFRIVSRHTPSKSGWALPNADTRMKLYLITRKNKAPTFLDLAIGSRVSCNANLGTQIGKESVNSLVFKKIYATYKQYFSTYK